jgi:hypothetical protein
LFVLGDENAAYIELLCGHLGRFTRRLRAIPAERWEWQPNAWAPSPRLLAQHAWLWLVCDRRHILEPDALRHPDVPGPPEGQSDLVALLEEETGQWRALLREMTAAEFAEPRLAFNWRRVNVRWLVWHMCQNVIYKHGQLAALYFQLGLDGNEPYRAPLPRDDYERLAEMMRHPAICGVLSGAPADLASLPAPAGLDERDRAGCTALHYAVWRGEAETVGRLLRHGANMDASYGAGWTALMDAAWLGDPEVVRVLVAHGARPDLRTTRGDTALALALEQGHSQVVDLLRQAGAEE